jgi:hypothetical protein
VSSLGGEKRGDCRAVLYIATVEIEAYSYSRVGVAGCRSE